MQQISDSIFRIENLFSQTAIFISQRIFGKNQIKINFIGKIGLFVDVSESLIEKIRFKASYLCTFTQNLIPDEENQFFPTD
jgi:hypothetical protein